MIFTLRSSQQGGSYPHSEEQRLIDLLSLATLQPKSRSRTPRSPNFLTQISSQYPKMKVIRSYHNFSQTPEDLDTLYREMTTAPATWYKMATFAQNSAEALRFLCWAKTRERLIAISMGPHGQISRVVGPLIASPITYASIDEEHNTSPGQLSAQTLIETYHYRSLTPHTRLLGLIGDPVSRSPSHITHNHLITTSGLDAVYVKMEVKPQELPLFIRWAKKLNFYGLSITMPLKEEILPLLDEIDPQAKEIGAVNTLLFREGKIMGYNTDGIGALNAIERHQSVKNKRILLLGAGGAAKAIAYEAHRRGARLTILNRSKERALQLANQFCCQGGSLEEMPRYTKAGYDILINSTPTSPIPADCILPEALIMDIVSRPKETPFLKLASRKNVG